MSANKGPSLAAGRSPRRRHPKDEVAEAERKKEVDECGGPYERVPGTERKFEDCDEEASD
jgi:hypothetical protein